MSAQFNDPPYFGGLVNANIRANAKRPLDLVTSGTEGYELPRAPSLLYTSINNGGVIITVALTPYNYPPPDANVVFKYRLSGDNVYTDFPSSSFVQEGSIFAWLGDGRNFTQASSYEIIATSGIFTSPILRVATGSTQTNNPTQPAGVPILLGVPTSTTMNLYFNVGLTGTTPNEYLYKIQRSTNGTTWDTAVAVQNVFGSLYSYQATGLTASTTYYWRSTVYANGILLNSASSAGFSTAAAGATAPSPAPNDPTLVSATSTSITVSFTGASGQTGSAPITYGIEVDIGSGTTIFFPANVSSGTATATATGLSPSTIYYFRSGAYNAGGKATSNANPGFSTTSAPPTAPLKTNLVTPFLIQGARFGVPYSQALDYYINVDAVGCYYAVGTNLKAQGQQLFGSMYGQSAVTGGKPNLAGFCIADQPYNESFGSVSDAYLKAAQSASYNGESVRLLTSWGGFYADILGLFSPYQPVNYPGTNPSAADVTKSFLYNFCGVTTGNTNPLNWSRQGYTVYFDGLVLDFENVGYGGNPNVGNQYPLPQSPAPSFPADATGATYTNYPAALVTILTTYYAIAPTLFLGNAPVSLSINGDGLLGGRNGNISASNTALNTWFAFANSDTKPSAQTFNLNDSLALNHPDQMSYFDDVFVQFYNENAAFYLGGSKFPTILAQWGYVALAAQLRNRKATKINIGLANGNIIPGFNAAGNAIVPSVQGPTPQLDNETVPPYTYFYPQYGTGSPPNQTNPSASQTWPNTGVTLDAINLASAINSANSMLQQATGRVGLKPSDWCSGTGFWAGGNATTTATAVYSGAKSSGLSPGTILPATNTYIWSDATYPSPDPLWGTDPFGRSLYLPIYNGLNDI